MTKKDKKHYIVAILTFNILLMLLALTTGPNEMPYGIKVMAANFLGAFFGIAVGGIWAGKDE